MVQVTRGSMKAWKRYVVNADDFDYRLVRGGDHYLVHSKAQELLRIIVNNLNPQLKVVSELATEHRRDGTGE